MKTLYAFLIALFCLPALASEVSLAGDPPMAHQLAKQPIALVEGNQCQIRGAVWAEGPRAGVNITLTSATGQVFKTKTSAAGIYAASLPYAGTTTTYQERIADPVHVRPALADKARVLNPSPIVCSKELTTAILKTINRSAN